MIKLFNCPRYKNVPPENSNESNILTQFRPLEVEIVSKCPIHWNFQCSKSRKYYRRARNLAR